MRRLFSKSNFSPFRNIEEAKMSNTSYVVGAVLAMILGQGALAPVRADVVVTGEGDAIELQTNGATVEEALAALGARFGMRYHSSVPLDRRISGTYRGGLEGVVSQTLAEYNFTIMNTDKGVEVWAMGVNESARPVIPGVAPSRPAAPEDKGEQRAPTVPLPASAAPIIPASSPELTRAFGKDAPPIQMSEEFVRAYVLRANRGNTRRNPQAQ
jgi:hypothetical protein